MIRLIQRRLIIPRGDTGSFTIPALGEVENGDVAVFCVFDTMTHKRIFTKMISPSEENLVINLTHNETLSMRPGKYVWDIRFYKNPDINSNDEIIDSEEINSYYAGFSLPVCEVRETAENWPHEEDDILVNTNISTLQTILKSLPSAIGEKF